MTPSLTLTTLVTAITNPYFPLHVPSTCGRAATTPETRLPLLLRHGKSRMCAMVTACAAWWPGRGVGQRSTRRLKSQNELFEPGAQQLVKKLSQVRSESHLC